VHIIDKIRFYLRKDSPYIWETLGDIGGSVGCQKVGNMKKRKLSWKLRWNQFPSQGCEPGGLPGMAAALRLLVVQSSQNRKSHWSWTLVVLCSSLSHYSWPPSSPPIKKQGIKKRRRSKGNFLKRHCFLENMLHSRALRLQPTLCCSLSSSTSWVITSLKS
jgi:hypothetical protein